MKEDGQKEMQIETNIFDLRTVYTNCTVEILENSVTGEGQRWMVEERGRRRRK